ncbi:Hypothetical predicted protein [Mytilus galloprovincialis]|uniref:Uncharacterized protein n=1 Tax=Mytilus galloprovincialis TaxID=29158 RepID=A0A8B6CVE8_MYTGA|nr:Hypothetical predicted protein [Mytilus galloprovincialis]
MFHLRGRRLRITKTPTDVNIHLRTEEAAIRQLSTADWGLNKDAKGENQSYTKEKQRRNNRNQLHQMQQEFCQRRNTEKTQRNFS